MFSKTEGGLKRRVGHYRWTKYLARYLSFFIRIFNRQYAYFYLSTVIFYCIFIDSIHVSNLKNVRSFYSSRGPKTRGKIVLRGTKNQPREERPITLLSPVVIAAFLIISSAHVRFFSARLLLSTSYITPMNLFCEFFSNSRFIVLKVTV